MQEKNRLKNAYVQIAAGALLLLVVAIIPLVLIGRFAHPCADDFSYGYYTHAFWSTTHSLRQTLYWAFRQVKATYDTWQGTFSSVFLMALSPAVWGEEYYFLTPIIMLTMIVLPHFFLLKVILVKGLETTKSIWIIISSLISFLLIETIFVPVEGLFWYNGAVHYVFMHGCMLLLFGVMLRAGSQKKLFQEILWYLAACILAVICGGSNYATALLGLLGLVFLVAMKWLGGKRSWSSLLPIAVYGFAFYKNVTAYGNTIRQANFEKGSPLEAIGNSFVQLFGYSKSWITLQIILFLLLLVPFLWKAAETSRFSFPLPPVITFLSVCSTACMLTPGIYAMGTPGAGRTINIIKMWFLFMVFLNEGYWIGYIRKKAKVPTCKLDVRIYVVGILLLILVSFKVNTDRQLLDYSSYAAYVSLRAGEAQQYHQQYMERLEKLSSSEDVVEVEAFSVKPRLLYFDDITENAYDWRNTSLARWYGKEKVIIVEQDG